MTDSVSTWNTLDAGLAGQVRALTIDLAGTLTAGWTSLSGGGIADNGVSCWNGTNWTTLVNGLDGMVNSVAATPGGALYIGGVFTAVAGISAGGLACWDGETWSSLFGGVDGQIYALAVDINSGALFVGGWFTHAGDVPASSVARWDGTSWSSLGDGVDGQINALAVGADGMLYAGGWFANAGGAPANNVARWTGTAWENLGDGVDGGVNALAVDGTGALYAGGDFANAGDLPANRVAKWTELGWENLGDGVSSDWGGEVDALATDNYGRLYAGGSFTLAGSVPAGNVARWTGVAWEALAAGVDSQVSALAVDREGALYAGGWFMLAGGEPANYIAQWMPAPTPTSGVTPSLGSCGGFYFVTIAGTNLGDGADITNVTLCGASVRAIVSQCATQVVVLAGSGLAGPGDVCVFSAHAGVTTATNVFTYVETGPVLTVQSSYGSGTPPVGISTNASGVWLTNTMAATDMRGTTQYVCAGWTLLGGTPEAGTTNRFAMQATNNAVLTWLWTTNYWVRPLAGAHGSVNATGAWLAQGTTATVTASAAPYFHFLNWSGDVAGAAAHENPLTVTIAASLSFQANFDADLASHQTPLWWLAQYGLTNGGLTFDQAERADADHDGQAAWQEYVAGTDPTDASSCLRITAIQNGPPWQVSFQSISGRVYDLQWSTDLVAGVWLPANAITSTNVFGTGGILTIGDPAAIGDRPRYERLCVRFP